MKKEKRKKFCLIYNFAQHYRKSIFLLMDKELACDFVFGDKMGDVKKLDYILLPHFKKEVKNKTFIRPPFYYQQGAISLLKEGYTHYIMLGDLNCTSTWLMLFLIKLQRRKIYFWSHGWYGKEATFRKRMKKIFFGLADGVFLYGNYAKQLMIKNGLNENKLHVIYNSLAYDEQKEIRKNLTNTGIFKKHFKNNCCNLIFVGRLTRIKQLDMLLQALYELNRQGEKYNLTLIGNGKMKEELSDLAQKLNIKENVWFYGATYNESKLSELIYDADLCVSPGNVGLTAMHALTYGCPVVTHDNFPYQMPEFEAIIEDKTGLFFEYNNLHSLIKTISNWFCNVNRDIVRKQCYEIIDTKYNPHNQIEIIKNVLDI
jgi:glycosyltransferase involved in cell wall biosynthesis